MRRFLRDPVRLRQLAGWFVVGMAAIVAELALLSALIEALAMPLWLASALAAEALILARFVVMDRWVFKHPRPSFDRLARYHGACAAALVTYWVVTNAAAQLFQTPYLLAAIVGTGASFSGSLLSNFLWVWSRPGPEKAGASPARRQGLESAIPVVPDGDPTLLLR